MACLFMYSLLICIGCPLLAAAGQGNLECGSHYTHAIEQASLLQVSGSNSRDMVNMAKDKMSRASDLAEDTLDEPETEEDNEDEPKTEEDNKEVPAEDCVSSETDALGKACKCNEKRCEAKHFCYGEGTAKVCETHAKEVKDTKKKIEEKETETHAEIEKACTKAKKSARDECEASRKKAYDDAKKDKNHVCKAWLDYEDCLIKANCDVDVKERITDLLNVASCHTENSFVNSFNSLSR